MKRLLSACLLLLCCQAATAQHDLYKWQLSGYTGLASYANKANSASDYFDTNHGLLYRAELTRSIGQSLGLSVSYAWGEVQGYDQPRDFFTTDVQTAAVRVYYYTDNGWLLNTSAIVSPYFFAGYGYSILETSRGTITDESRYVPVVPVGVGLKFRMSERWQLALQAEAVYVTEPHLEALALEQNDYNSSYLQAGITVGYSFGFRTSTFKAPQFYVANGDLPLPEARQSQPRQNMLEAMLKLEPKEVRLVPAPGAAALPQPGIPKVNPVLPVDTVAIRSTAIDIDADTSALVQQRVRTVPVVPAPAPDTATTAPPAAAPLPENPTTTNTTAAPPAPREQQRVGAEQPYRATAAEQPVVQEPRRLSNQQPAQETQVQQAPATRERVDVNVQQQAPDRARQAGRVEERVIYVPAGVAPAQDTEQAQAAPTAVDAEIKRLQAQIDSLKATQQADTLVPVVAAAAVDSSLLHRLELQTALSDSMLQRLNRYEQEIVLLKTEKVVPVPVSPPAAMAPKMSSTTVYFPINAYQIPVGSLADLDQVLEWLQEKPALRVKLTGYASQSGNPAYNMALSRKRVASLQQFLINRGVAAERIRTEHLGAAASSEKENPLDRKVRIEVVE